jgi:hypothetical protein
MYLHITNRIIIHRLGNALNQNTPTVVGEQDSTGGAHATLYTNVLRAAVNYRF